MSKLFFSTLYALFGQRKRKTLIVALVFGMLLAACSVETPSPTATSDPNAVATAAVRTFAAELTSSAAQTPSATATREPSPTVVTPAVTQTPEVQITPGPIVTNSPDQAELVDQSPPDGSEVGINTEFDAVWVVRNAGTTTWTRQYSIRYFSGAMFAQTDRYFFPRDVPPGEEVRLVVDMIARSYPGRFNTNWVLTNADGVNFYPLNLQVSFVEGPTQTPTPTHTPTATPTEE
jgi:hypothetical protein